MAEVASQMSRMLLCPLLPILLLSGCLETGVAPPTEVALSANAFSASGSLADEPVEISLGSAVPCEASPGIQASCLPAQLGQEKYLIPVSTMEPLLQGNGEMRVAYGPTAVERLVVFAPLRLVGVEQGIGISRPFQYLGVEGSSRFTDVDALELSFIERLVGPEDDRSFEQVYELQLEAGTAVPRSIQSYLRDETGKRMSRTDDVWMANSLTVKARIEGIMPAGQSAIPLAPIGPTGAWVRAPPSDSSVQGMRFPLAQAVAKAREQSQVVRDFFEAFPDAFLVDATYQSQFTTAVGPTSLLWIMQWEGEGSGLRFSVQLDLAVLPDPARQYQTEVIAQSQNQVSDLEAQRRDDMVPIDWAYSACVTNEQEPFLFGYRDLDTDDTPPERLFMGGVPYRLPAWYDCQFEGSGHQRDAYLGNVVAWT